MDAVVLIDAGARERLAQDPSTHEAFLHREVDQLEWAYQQGTPPHVIALAAESISRSIGSIHAGSSAQRARLRGLIGQMLVAGGGDSAMMAVAERHLVAAQEELCSVGDWRREHVRLLVELVLNQVVTLKARGRASEAVQLLRGTISDRALSPYWSRGDRLPLVRQDVIMVGGLKPHRWLAEQREDMQAAGPLEHYRTVKRIFEFAMNAGEDRATARLIHVAKRAFRPVASRVPQLARISFVKNVGQHEALAGDPERALMTLALARAAAEEHNLHGQVRQIDGLITLIRGGERPRLGTFLTT